MCNERCPCDIDPLCMDCGADTDELHEYYMVYDRIWKRAVPKRRERKRQICVGCLEKRLGRELAPKDFTKAPVNKYPVQSRRLRKRLGRTRLPRTLEGQYARIRDFYADC